MKLWIARDENGALAVFANEVPTLYDDRRFNNFFGEFIVIDSQEFPEVTFENSPMEVELKLVNND